MRQHFLRVTMFLVCVFYSYLGYAEQSVFSDFSIPPTENLQSNSEDFSIPPTETHQPGTEDYIIPSTKDLSYPQQCNLKIVQNGNYINITWNPECFPNSYYISIFIQSEYIQEKEYRTNNDGNASIHYSFSFDRIRICLRGIIDTNILCGELYSIDQEKPTGQISRINSSYNIGDVVNYSLTARDNKDLSELEWTVANSYGYNVHERKWSISGTYTTRSSYFSTNSLASGKYNYSLLIKDSSNNIQTYSGFFQIIDTQKPTGRIENLRNEYEIGETIYCVLSGHDETSLRSIFFSITDINHISLYNRKWYVYRTLENKYISIPTESWNEGQYTCTMRIEDSSGNSMTYSDSFRLYVTNPLKPVTPIAISTSSTSIKVSWNGSSNASSFSLWREFNGVFQKIYCGSKTYYYDNYNILPATTYTYKIKAAESDSACYNQAYWSIFSEPCSVKTMDVEDFIKPTGKISFEPTVKYQNGSISYAIEALDNKKLSEINLVITDSSGLTKHDSSFFASTNIFVKTEYIDTKDWGIGLFNYTLSIKDSSKNESHSSGSFEIVPRTEIFYEIKDHTKAIPGSTVSIPIVLHNPSLDSILAIYIVLQYDSNVLEATSATLEGGFLEGLDYTIGYNTNIEGKVLIVLYNTISYICEGIVLKIDFNVIGEIGDTTELTMKGNTNEIENISNKGLVEIVESPPAHPLTINASIIDCHTNNPVENSSILNNDYYVSYSNNDGTFQLVAQQPGIYTISVIADGYFSYSNAIEFLQNEVSNIDIPICPIRKKAIIIAGSNKNDANWPAYHLCSMDAIDRLIDVYEIKHLHPDSTPVASAESISDAITRWAQDADELLLYMVGHGHSEQFILKSDTIGPDLIKKCLDDLQQTMKGTLVVIYDACFSGTFIKKLLPPPEKQRIILTSTSSNETALFDVDGAVSFSHVFWNCNAMVLNESLKKAFHDTLDIIEKQKGVFPAPHVDANGNGIPGEAQDFEILKKIFIRKKRWESKLGNSTKRYAARKDIVDETVLKGNTSYLISAQLTNEMKDIKKVIAIIYPPDTPITKLIEVQLEKIDQENYAAVYNNLSHKGTYRINIFAVDSESVYSILKRSIVIQEEEPDTYENDDSIFLANAMDKMQHHNFQKVGDEDWTMFYGTESVPYTILISNAGKDCNAVIEIYNDKGNAIVDPQNITHEGENEMIQWICPQNGLYYVKISNNDPQLYGNETFYDLSLFSSQTMDIYEPDNNIEQARSILISSDKSQYHNFHKKEDRDWVKFYGLNNQFYVIKVDITDIKVNARIDIFDDKGTFLVTSNNYADGKETINWKCMKDGIYYIKISSSNCVEKTDYALSIYLPEGSPPAYMVGWVRDEYSAAPIRNALITVDNSFAVLSKEGGAFCLPLESGNHNLTVECDGYQAYSLNKHFELFNYFEVNIDMVSEHTLRDVIWALKVLADIPVNHYDTPINVSDRKIGLADVIYRLSNVSQ